MISRADNENVGGESLKRILSFIAVLSCLLLAGCVTISNGNESSQNTSAESSTSTVSSTNTTQYINENYYIDESGLLIGQGNYDDIDWDNELYPYSKDIVPNKDIAIVVANAYLAGMDNGRYAQTYVVYGVFYNENDKAWIVSFNKGQQSLDNGLHMKIKKSTGELLNIGFSLG